MRLSRSKVDLFIQCPLCFWLDQKSKVKRPSGPPFSLNIAVDHLLKNEFDESRGKDVPERLARENLSFVPTNHPLLSRWRENFKGVTRQYKGIEFFGAIDDLWHDLFGVHYVVDYKATSKADEVSLDADGKLPINVKSSSINGSYGVINLRSPLKPGLCTPMALKATVPLMIN